MIKISDIYNYIDNIAPFNTQMDFDNSGLLVGDMHKKVTNVLVALDITKEIIEEAKNFNANLIISHHPVIFKPIKNLLSDSIPYLLAKNEINAICAHTNLDISDVGVNYCLAQAVGLIEQKPFSIYSSKNYKKIVVFVPKDFTEDVKQAMSNAGAGSLGNYFGCNFVTKGYGSFLPMKNAKPFLGKIGEYEKVKEDKLEMICKPSAVDNVIKAMKTAHPYEEVAFDIFETSAVKEKRNLGIIGELKENISPEKFAHIVKSSLSCNGVRYVKGNKQIKKVAVCSGAGGDMVFDAIYCNVDAFVTGEIKHHELLEAQKAGLTVIDAGHHATEDIVLLPLIDLLSKKFLKLKFKKSQILKDLLYC